MSRIHNHITSHGKRDFAGMIKRPEMRDHPERRGRESELWDAGALGCSPGSWKRQGNYFSLRAYSSPPCSLSIITQRDSFKTSGLQN
jgi:hypothetical protein